MNINAQEIVKEHLVFFKEAPERSLDRKNIVNECFKMAFQRLPLFWRPQINVKILIEHRSWDFSQELMVHLVPFHVPSMEFV